MDATERIELLRDQITGALPRGLVLMATGSGFTRATAWRIDPVTTPESDLASELLRRHARFATDAEIDKGSILPTPEASPFPGPQQATGASGGDPKPPMGYSTGPERMPGPTGRWGGRSASDAEVTSQEAYNAGRESAGYQQSAVQRMRRFYESSGQGREFERGRRDAGAQDAEEPKKERLDYKSAGAVRTNFEPRQRQTEKRDEQETIGWGRWGGRGSEKTGARDQERGNQEMIEDLRRRRHEAIRAGEHERAKTFEEQIKRLGGDAEIATDPPVSEQQRKAMHAAASGHSTLGIPKNVGEEFVESIGEGHHAR